MIAVSYLMKRKIKKIFLEVISNTKILFNKAANDQNFAKLTGKLDNVEYGTKFNRLKLIKIKYIINLISRVLLFI